MRHERGSATVVLLACLALVATMLSAGLAFARVAVVRARVSAAADLSALAGARGGDCAAAAAVAAANAAVLRECSVASEDMLVSVSAPVPIVPGYTAQVTASARAGPPS